MSHFVCPSCQHESDIFGKGGGETLAARAVAAVPRPDPDLRADSRRRRHGVPISIGEPDRRRPRAPSAGGRAGWRRSCRSRATSGTIPLTVGRVDRSHHGAVSARPRVIAGPLGCASRVCLMSCGAAGAEPPMPRPTTMKAIVAIVSGDPGAARRRQDSTASRRRRRRIAARGRALGDAGRADGEGRARARRDRARPEGRARGVRAAHVTTLSSPRAQARGLRVPDQVGRRSSVAILSGCVTRSWLAEVVAASRTGRTRTSDNRRDCRRRPCSNAASFKASLDAVGRRISADTSVHPISTRSTTAST